MKIFCTTKCTCMLLHAKNHHRCRRRVKCEQHSVNSLKVDPEEEADLSLGEILHRNVDHNYHKEPMHRACTARKQEKSELQRDLEARKPEQTGQSGVNLRSSNVNHSTPASPTLSTPPTLNLMEQLLLAKIEKQNFHEDDLDTRVEEKKRNFLLRRTDSMDSQTSASTYNSLLSSDSTSSGNFYCKCDDCLLGIVDDYQRSLSVVGRKKVCCLKTVPVRLWWKLEVGLERRETLLFLAIHVTGNFRSLFQYENLCQLLCNKGIV